MRHLPVIYGGRDAGSRPETRRQVYGALERGVDPIVVVEHVARGVSQLWDQCCAASTADLAPACAPGCAWCCRQRVEVTAPEVFLLLRWWTLEHPTEVVALAQRAMQTATQLQGLSGREHYMRQVPCVFSTAAGTCDVYAARPLACRRAHSLDANVCKALSTSPEGAATVPESEVLRWNTSALVVGYYEGLVHAGLSPAQYELTSALALALTVPDAEARWLRGEDVLGPALTRSAEALKRTLDRTPE